jgi:hypothetical protein
MVGACHQVVDALRPHGLTLPNYASIADQQVTATNPPRRPNQPSAWCVSVMDASIPDRRGAAPAQPTHRVSPLAATPARDVPLPWAPPSPTSC